MGTPDRLLFGRPISLYLAVVAAVITVANALHVIVLDGGQEAAINGLFVSVLFLVASSHTDTLNGTYNVKKSAAPGDGSDGSAPTTGLTVSLNDTATPAPAPAVDPTPPAGG